MDEHVPGLISFRIDVFSVKTSCPPPILPNNVKYSWFECDDLKRFNKYIDYVF